jgi:hypothetical protein
MLLSPQSFSSTYAEYQMVLTVLCMLRKLWVTVSDRPLLRGSGLGRRQVSSASWTLLHLVLYGYVFKTYSDSKCKTDCQ